MKIEDFPKSYEPKDHEEKIYRAWETSGFFNPDKLPEKRYPKNAPLYTAMLPPPNITGVLHMGHALNATIQDILIRKKRMEGFRTLWLPGTDHASIATHNVIERELKKEGKTRFDLGREKFLERAWAWKEKYGDIILNQLKKIGASCDWSRTRFTMNENYQKEVETAFLYYYKKGLIYRGKRTVNWCARCGTSLSDLEVEYREENGKFYYIKYGPVTIGTVRPETKLGDTALAVHPNDKRYADFVGKKITIQTVDPATPRTNPPHLENIEIMIIADEAADPEFGSGIIKVTPAHDIADFEISQRHPNVPTRTVIGEKGRMTREAGARYEGLTVKEAREQITKDLQDLGLIEKIEEYKHNIAVCARCGTVLEPLLSEQWFLKMDELAKIAKEAVASGKISFHPKKWEKIYFEWLDNTRDWCISRQLWWGHKIPVEGSEDILDTWFSSALWPYATLYGEDRTRFYPGNVVVSARDIINLWIGRMIFSGIEFMNDIPFRDVIIHATILTKEGKRMSKSLGTGVDPMNLIEKYGADATRFGLVWQAMGGQDIHWAEEHVVAGKKFLNKLWNSWRFISGQIGSDERALKRPEPHAPSAIHILDSFDTATKQVDLFIDQYEFGHALHCFYDFYWHDFCDIFIEEAKKDNSPEMQETLFYIYASSLKFLHPFIPFITEQLWSYAPVKDKTLLMVESLSA